MSDEENTNEEAAAEPQADYARVGGILGRKLQMTQIFDENGKVQPVTVVEVGPCSVLQVKTPESDGYSALQLGFGERKLKRLKKPQRGHLAKLGRTGKDQGVAFVREVAFKGDEPPAEVGAELKAEMFEAGAKIDVIGTSKGRGFAGTIKRHNFHRGPETHGSHNVRAPGSIGQAADPSRTFKGMKGPGQMGNKRVTVKNLTVVKVLPEKNLLMIRGQVPGPTGGFVVINKTYFASQG